MATISGDGVFPPGPGSLPPPPPVTPGRRRRLPYLIGIGVVALALVGAYLAFGESDSPEGVAPAHEPSSYSDHGLTFDIPEGLHLLSAAERDELQITDLPPGVRSPTDGPWFEVLALDDVNMLVIFPDDLGFVVDETNVGTYARIVSTAAQGLTGDPLRVVRATLAGFPSIEIQAHEVETPDGLLATNELVEAFDGNHGYGFMCQYEGGSQMREMCHEVLEGVSIETDPTRAGWTTLDSEGGHLIDVPPGWSDESPVARELIHAAYFLPGDDVPLAELQLNVDPILGDNPPPRRFVNDVVGGMKGSGFSLLDRSPVSLPAGDGEKLVFRAGNTRVVTFALVHEAQGITIWVATFSDQETMDLLAPTAEAMARSLAIEG